jgi:hypothetical protein
LSTISLTQSLKSATQKGLSKTKKITTDSHEGNVIIGITCLIFAIVFVLGIIGPFIYSYYGGLTSLGLDENTKCAQKIHEYQQKGYYSSPEQFKAAISTCYVK